MSMKTSRCKDAPALGSPEIDKPARVGGRKFTLCFAGITMEETLFPTSSTFSRATPERSVSKPEADRLLRVQPEHVADNFFSDTTGQFFRGSLGEHARSLEGPVYGERSSAISRRVACGIVGNPGADARVQGR